MLAMQQWERAHAGHLCNLCCRRRLQAEGKLPGAEAGGRFFSDEADDYGKQQGSLLLDDHHSSGVYAAVGANICLLSCCVAMQEAAACRGEATRG